MGVCPRLTGLALVATLTVVDACVMFSVYACNDELPRKLASPSYHAVIMWAPGERVESVNCATPFDKVTLPREVESVVSKKFTVPVGIPENCGCTVAERVNGCPKGTVFTLLPSVNVVCAWLTVSIAEGEVEAK